MLYKKFLILFFVIGFVTLMIPAADAGLLKKSTIDMYLENDLIVFGKITSARDYGDKASQTEYQIEIIQFVKGDKSQNKITALGLGSFNATRHLDNETIFLEGQQVFLFLNIPAGTFIISPYSRSIESFEPDSFILPPLKLFNAGITIDEINCKSSLVLVIKNNDTPACVKPDSVNPLLNRGWISLLNSGVNM